jgi:dipeptidyl aminopeptidase/acylaminoacyl peptidase
MAQVRSGAYRTPTFIIHGDRDEVVPCSMGTEFITELQMRGVAAGIKVVKGARHIFDLKCKPGDRLWEEHIAPGYEFLFECLKQI